MEVTEVRVYLREEDRLKAFVTVTFDHCFIVRDMKIIRGHKGLFVAMPSKKKKDGTFGEVAHPLNAEMREKIETAVLERFEQAQENGELLIGEGF
jgi:stage V sporulation protein G